jgi:hypothetical protein
MPNEERVGEEIRCTIAPEGGHLEALEEFALTQAGRPRVSI